MKSDKEVRLKLSSFAREAIVKISQVYEITITAAAERLIAAALDDSSLMERYFKRAVTLPPAQAPATQPSKEANLKPPKPPTKAEARAQILNRILKVVNLVNSYDDNKEGRYTLQILGNNETVCDFQNKQNLTIGQGALDYLEKTYWIFLQEDIDPNDKTMLISEGKYTKEEYEAHYNYWQRAQTD